jgi:hypothetical protein
MKRLLLVTLLALPLAGCGPSGCSTISALASNDKGVLQGQKLDEQVMGGVDALGTSANVLLEAAAKSGAATRKQLLAAQKIRREMDLAHSAAFRAYQAGDAVTFKDRLAAVTDLNKQATALFNEVKK